jgi:hypothetical protein
MDRSSIEEEFFCQGRFSGIRVGDDGKRPSPPDFLVQTPEYSRLTAVSIRSIHQKSFLFLA